MFPRIPGDKTGESRVLSRHRLPRFYRISLAALWATPVGLFALATLSAHGITPIVLDPRFWLPLAVLLIPAVYIWHEGVDVLKSGIITRVHWPRYHQYCQLDNWYFDSRAGNRTLTIWDVHNRKVLECRAGHLTDLPHLLAALKANLRNRNGPE